MRNSLTRFFASRTGIVLTGATIGVLAVLLQRFGNPANMGICVACFERDIAGALGLHRAAVVQYLRPEIMAFILGSFLSALLFGEFKARMGSAPAVRFFLGMFAMIGALAFLGCPWRALLRLAAGDFNAITGIAGLAVGVSGGVMFLKSGYNLGRSNKTYAMAGLLLPILAVALLALRAARFSTGDGMALFFSIKGPGSMHAPVWISLTAGLIIGILAQRSRFCTMGAIRDVILMKEFHMLSGLIALVIAAFLMNLAFGYVKTGFSPQPVAHSLHLWNFLGMTLSGLAFALAGGCPGRQLFLVGEGDGDAAVFVVGMVAGAAVSHNFGLAGSPDAMVAGVIKTGGISSAGMTIVVTGIVFCLLIGWAMREKQQA
jgi:YedE family putative selenium metabolism protein